MFTLATVIGRNPKLFRGFLKNMKEHAGFDRIEGDKEILAIVYKNKNIPVHISDEILGICEENDVRAEVFLEPDNNFLNNLYTSYNLMYQLAQDGPVFRVCSDQALNKNALPNLLEVYRKIVTFNPKIILQANTVENLDAPAANQSRHLRGRFGNNFEDFDVDGFEKFCFSINQNAPAIVSIEQALLLWGHPTGFMSSLGPINRADGCSWLCTKKDWEQYGPMIPINQNGITGDVTFLDKLHISGYQSLIVRDCVTYHMVQCGG